MNVNRGFVSILTLGAIVALTAPGAAAKAKFAEANEISSAAVSFADLNLDSRAGAEVLVRRITRAASEVCGGEPTRFNLGSHSYYKACVRAATDRAVETLDAPTVTALWFNEVSPARTGFENTPPLRD